MVAADPAAVVVVVAALLPVLVLVVLMLLLLLQCCLTFQLPRLLSELTRSDGSARAHCQGSSQPQILLGTTKVALLLQVKTLDAPAGNGSARRLAVEKNEKEGEEGEKEREEKEGR